jgi:multisubunit Na+/H+ antiporter MnhE subunit
LTPGAVLRGAVPHVRAWIAFWLALFWLWMLLVGEWTHIDWIAGASAATVAATIAELARARVGAAVRVPLEWVAKAWTVPAMIVVDFGIVMWALARRRRGTVRERPSPATRSAGIRAWANLAANYSPNSFVIDLDPESRTVLVHDLLPFKKSEEPT